MSQTVDVGTPPAPARDVVTTAATPASRLALSLAYGAGTRTSRSPTGSAAGC